MATNQTTLDANELVALAKAGSLTQGLRDRLAPGKHEVNCEVHIHGTITVGESYLARKTARLLSIATLAHVIRCSGATGPHAIKWVMEAMRAAAEAPDGEKEGKRWLQESYGAEVALLDSAIDGENERLGDLPMETHNGKITAKLTVEDTVAVEV